MTHKEYFIGHSVSFVHFLGTFLGSLNIDEQWNGIEHIG